MAVGWTKKVEDMIELLHKGDAVLQMMQVTGEEGVTLEDFVTYQKSLFLDMVYLQQDAFDKVDASCSLERQKLSFSKVYELIVQDYNFSDKAQIHDFFIRLTGLFKNFNYAGKDTPQYLDLLKQIDELAGSMEVL